MPSSAQPRKNGADAATDIEKTIRAYVNLRDELDVISAQAKQKAEPLQQALEFLEKQLHDMMKAHNVESFKTAAGTAFTKKRDLIKVGDWDAFFAWMLSTENHHFLVRNVAKDPVKEYIEEYGKPPVGIDYDSEIVVQVRRPK